MIEVGRTDAHRQRIRVVQRVRGYAAVVLERSHRSDEHRRVRTQSAGAALDVHELLKAEVCSETGLGYDVIGVAEREAVCHDGAASVGDVAEWPRMDERGLTFRRLHEVRQERLPQQGHERTDRAHLRRRYGLSVLADGDGDTGKPLSEVCRVGGEREDSHDL